MDASFQDKSMQSCTSNCAKKIDQLIDEHHRNVQIMLQVRSQEIEFLTNRLKSKEEEEEIGESFMKCFFLYKSVQSSKI